MTTSESKTARPVLLVAGVVSVLFLILVDASGTIALRDAVGAYFGEGRAGLVYACYFVAYASPLLVAGRLGDRLGHRRLLLWSTAGFLVATLAAGQADTFPLLILTRTCQGLLGGIATPQLLSLLKLHVPARLRGAAMTAHGVVVVIAFFGGPAFAGVATVVGSWRLFYLGQVPLGVVSLCLIAASSEPDRAGSMSRVDPLSGVLSFVLPLTICAGLLVGGADVVVALVLLATGVAALFLFRWRQRVLPADTAISPPRMFGVRNFTLASVVAVQLGFATTVMLAAVMQYLREDRGLGEVQSGLILTPMAVLALLFAPVAARQTSRGREWHLVLSGFVLFSLCVGFLAFRGGSGTPIATLLGLSAVCGIASTCVFGALSAVSIRDVEPSLSGASSGFYNFGRQFGAALGASAAVALAHVDRTDGSWSWLPGTRAAAVLVLSTAVMITGAITTAVALRSRPGRS
ncbi:MFS transporter [Amycolatopsis sp. NPDC005003]